MITEEKIKRINELAHKKKTTGLTQEEIKEQETLRRAYIDSVKSNLRQQMAGIKKKT